MTVAAGLHAMDFARPPGMEPGPLQVTLGGWAKLGGGLPSHRPCHRPGLPTPLSTFSAFSPLPP